MRFSALLLIPGSLLLWPLIDHWLQDDEQVGPLEGFTLALVFSPALMSLGLFWLGLLPGRWISGWSALLIGGTTLSVGLMLNPGWIDPAGWRRWWGDALRRGLRFDLDSWLVLLIAGSALITLTGTLYYPFTASDTLSRYALQAREIYETGHIPATLFGYPLNVPMGFVVSWVASGGIHEGLAKAMPWALGMGAVLATYLLGREIKSRRLGLLAAAIVAATPMFAQNVGIAYVDLPATFPVTLALLYTLRWWRYQRWRDALLAGLLVAVGLWTKQSALTYLASLAALPLVAWIAQRSEPGIVRRSLVTWLLLLIPTLLIAGPWYLRNYLLGGAANVIPSAGAIHILQARHSLLNLIPPLGWPRDFGYWLVPVYAVGWLWGAWRAMFQGLSTLRAQQQELPADLLIALLGLPYWVAWLTQFTFEARFLLLVLPLMALWAAHPLNYLIEQSSTRLRLSAWMAQVLALVLMVTLTLLGSSNEVGAVYHALRDPFATYDAKRERLDPTVYPVIQTIRETLDPQQTQLCVMEGGHSYYLYDYHPRILLPLHLSDLEGCNYLLHSTGFLSTYTVLGWQGSEFYRYVWNPEVFEVVVVNRGLHLMRVLRTTPPEG